MAHQKTDSARPRKERTLEPRRLPLERIGKAIVNVLGEYPGHAALVDQAPETPVMFDYAEQREDGTYRVRRKKIAATERDFTRYTARWYPRGGGLPWKMLFDRVRYQAYEGGFDLDEHDFGTALKKLQDEDIVECVVDRIQGAYVDMDDRKHPAEDEDPAPVYRLTQPDERGKRTEAEGTTPQGEMVLHADDLRILQVLLQAKTTLVQAAIEHKVKGGHNAVQRRLVTLEAEGLVHRPRGARSGYTITAAGQERLQAANAHKDGA